MRYVVLDTETTGLDPLQGHRVIEIGCVEIVNRRVTQRHFHTYLNPDRDSDPGALAVHGLTTDFLSDKPRFQDTAEDLLAFLQGAEIVIHNAEFDTRFVNAELARIGRGVLHDHCVGVIDSLMHARELHPGKRNSLDALCERYGISNAHRTLHGALLDARLLAEVWLAMTRGQDALAIDLGDAAQSRGAGVALERFDASVLPVIAASAQETADHAQYLAALDKAVGGECVWRKFEPAPAAPGA